MAKVSIKSISGIQHYILKMHPNHRGFILAIQGWFNNIKSINTIHYTNNRRKRGKTTTHEKVFYPKMFRKSLKKN